ncbi:sensor histidine kinase [Rhodohalobacter sp. 8-1]|uniref:sensor histidine kinase n=1 Tax=Rhodohalobacter sp. 8-1 TaxID=3131972 RepID=UPI0030ED1F4F
MDNRKMKDHTAKGLRSLISESDNPVFLLETDQDLIFEANSASIAACGPYNPIGESINNVVHIELPGGLVFFDNRWLEPKRELISLNKKTFTKLVLQHPASIPDENTLFTIRNMIAVLLHRLRSPMTGMQGYLELVGSVSDETDQRKLSKVSEGLDYLFEIMDELELLHHADAFIEDEPDSELSNAESVIREILYTFDPEIRNRISVRNNSQNNFQFNSAELKQILTLLIDNATEHSSGAGHPIKIEIESENRINITNWGSPIPDEIASTLYYPFVTTKANNLGIGLSLAQIIASRRRGIILLTENSEENGICFSLFCSPESLD